MNEPDFEVCRYESRSDFTNGCAIAYFDFCDWISHLDATVHFDSTQSLFDRFVTSHQIELTDSYRHPSWLDDIFWLLDFALTSTSKRLGFFSREHIEAVIRQKRTTYFHHYPL